MTTVGEDGAFKRQNDVAIWYFWVITFVTNQYSWHWIDATCKMFVNNLPLAQFGVNDGLPTNN